MKITIELTIFEVVEVLKKDNGNIRISLGIKFYSEQTILNF